MTNQLQTYPTIPVSYAQEIGYTFRKDLDLRTRVILYAYEIEKHPNSVLRFRFETLGREFVV